MPLGRGSSRWVSWGTWTPLVLKWWVGRRQRSRGLWVSTGSRFGGTVPRRRRRRSRMTFQPVEIDQVTKDILLPGPPPGSYDPALDYQAGTARRGYGYTQEDIAAQRARDTIDYGLATKDIDT